MDELDPIEQQLRARMPIPTASEITSLKPRTLAAMRLARGKKSSTSLWYFTASAAAVVVLAANATLASLQTQPLAPNRSRDSVALAQELHELLPELDARDAARHALLLEAGSRTSTMDLSRLRGGWVRGELEQ